MKKHWMIPGLCLLLLASCSSRNEGDWKKDVNSRLPDYQEVNYTKYCPSTAGEISASKDGKKIPFAFLKPEDSYALPSGKYDEATNSFDNGKSYLFLLPIRISKENFLSKDDNDAGSGYGVFLEQFCYSYDYVTKLQFRTMKDGGFEFYTKGTSKMCMIKNYYCTDGPDDASVSVYGRYDFTATYDSDGLLVKESCQSVDYQSRSDYVDVSCTYSYL